jgi:hypothetical protein
VVAGRREPGAGRAALLAAFAFVLAAAPFLALQLGARGADDSLSWAGFREALAGHLPPAYLDVGLAVRGLARVFSDGRAAVAAAALAGLGWLAWCGGRERALALAIACWALGVALVSVAVPWLDQTLARARDAAPVQVDLVRGIRYAVPLSLLALFACLARAQARLAASAAPPRRLAAAGLAAAALAFTGWWVARHPAPEVGSAIACLARGRLTCPPAAWRGVRAAVEAARSRLPPGATLLATRNPVLDLDPSLRFQALHPVVHASRDLGVLLYVRRGALPAWAERERRVRRIHSLPDASQRLSAWLELASELGADYTLLYLPHFPLPAGGGPEVVWRSQRFALVRVTQSGDDGAPALEGGSA